MGVWEGEVAARALLPPSPPPSLSYLGRPPRGLGVIHQSSQFAAIRTTAATTRLPAFTRVDAAVYYRVSDTVQLQLNIENLLDTTYFSDAHNNFNISTGAPLNARLTLAAQF